MIESVLRAELPHIDLSEMVTGEIIGAVTPGEVLRDEFMQPLGLSARALARALGVPPDRVTEIVNGRARHHRRDRDPAGRAAGHLCRVLDEFAGRARSGQARQDMGRAA